MSDKMLLEGQIRSADRGLSIVELLIVIVIISIVGSIALMQTGTPNRQLKRQNVARELKVALERARFDSVKRRATSNVTATDDERARVIITADSYTLVTDNNRNGEVITGANAIESGDGISISLAGQDIVIAGNGIVLPVTVLFNQRGEATMGGGGTNPIFYVCNIDCSIPTANNANLVLVTPTGTVNLLAGNASPPSFANANVTTVPTTTGVSNTVALP